MTPRTAPLPEVHNECLAPIRWREFDGWILVTNDAGEFAWLEKAAFGDLLAGTLDRDQGLWRELESKNLVRGSQTDIRLVERIRSRSHHLTVGPSLHILILTLRCNQACTYCHANRRPPKATGFDMTEQTARRALEVIFSSPSPDLTIEFQGGEPSLNFKVLRTVVEDAYRRNEHAGKRLYFSMVSNLSSLTRDQIHFLVDHGVMVCTSIDGPAPLHDHHRRFPPRRSSHECARQTMELFNQAYRDRGLDPGLAYVNALVTVSRSALRQPEAIVDEYVRLGQKVVHLRPLNPFGMGKRIWSQEGYTADEFLDFYRRAIDHILRLNRQGIEMAEKMASLLLTRILTDQDTNYVDLRSPCGAGVGQLAYNYDGRVYTCDEGRMVGAMGDDLFCIGDVHQNGYVEIVRHAGVRSLCVASCAECLPGCSECVYLPYCGVCPVYNYIEEGDLVARCPANQRCRIFMGILDHLFRRLREPEHASVLKKWIETRDRSSVYRRLV